MTVGLVIVSHSAKLAAGIVELAGLMVQGKASIAAAGGGIDDISGTAADKIASAIQSVNGPDGVLVLLDMGSAILSTEMAVEMLDDEQQRRVRISAAPLVEGAVAAALEASLGHSLVAVQKAAEATASVEQLRRLKPLAESEVTEERPPSIEAAPAQGQDTIQVTLTLTNPTGLHARPASLFVQAAAQFQARVRASGRGKETDASSIVGVLSLGLRQGDTLGLSASGSDAQAAIESLSELVRANFYETPAGTTSDATLSPVPATRPPVALQPGEPWHVIQTSAGVALGPALLFTSSSINANEIERRAIDPARVFAEQERLRQALAAAADELHELASRLQDSIGKEQAAIFDAQALMLRDPVLSKAALQQIEQEHIDAASALASASEQYASEIASLDDPLLAARAVDVRDATIRAILRLRGQEAPRQDMSSASQPVILVARALLPSDTAQLSPENVLGIVTVEGGFTAHAAILARALGIPAAAGLPESALLLIRSGDEVGLDADNSLFYHHPTPEVGAQLAQRGTERRQQQAALKAVARQTHAPLLINGRAIHLMANAGSEAEVGAARQWGAEGIGLLRTEFLFARAKTLPDEEAQRELYAGIFRAFAGDAPQQTGPIVVRTLDAGADKPMPALDAVLGPMKEDNPALGLRGIRIQLAHEELLEQQLSALLRAAAETGIELHIMFPMITTVEELLAARAVFQRVYDRLRKQGLSLPAHVPVGIMVEVPAAVIMAAELAEIADFFSIGSNDLSQYTLASDRTNPNLASLYHPMQPAVLRSIRQVAEAGQQAGKPVAVCGESAGDPRVAPLLVALGVSELSMTPNALPAVRSALVRWSAQDLSELGERLSHLKTVAEVEQASSRS